MGGMSFTILDHHTGQIPLGVLRGWLVDHDIQWSHVAQYARFHPDRYLRNSIHIGPAYQALVLCWRSGQRSPIHDHEGSNCVVRVLKGVATETVFASGPNGMIYAESSRDLMPGDICAQNQADIHQVSNLQVAGADLVTFHMYSPPLFSMNVYSLEDGSVRRFDDPINYDFLAGAGI